MTNNFSEIVQKLKSVKNSKGYTNEILSELSGVSLGTLNKLFSMGLNSIKLETLFKLCSALKTDIADVVSDDKDELLSACITEKPIKAERYGYAKVAAGTPKIRVADVEFNGESILETVDKAAAQNVEILVLPELCITGYTCGDLFFQSALLDAAKGQLRYILEKTADKKMLIILGLPLKREQLLYNCAVAIYKGKILGVIPKTNIPNYNEFYEKRHFASYRGENTDIEIDGESVLFGTKILFKNASLSECRVAIEICEDMWVASSPSEQHALCGATLIANPSCSDEIIGKADYRRNLVSLTSAKLLCGYIYSDAGDGESTQDMVFAGHNLIAENGKILAETKLFENGLAVSEIDFSALEADRLKQFNGVKKEGCGYATVEFETDFTSEKLTRNYSETPFVPQGKTELNSRAELILRMQAEGLKKRIEHTHCKTLVIGISGGLDSTLALLVAARALKLLDRPPSDILAITMPCFGTTKRTKGNAGILSEIIGATLKEINITEAVRTHFNDIGQSETVFDVTFENSQARERTQVLMDLANKTNGMVVGTGDLSELALGFATYNGDHMSMYGVNASVPKTLIRHLINYEAKNENGKLREVLNDILDTPVSPELLPADNETIKQRTEDIVGPYVLHDYFLYFMLRFGFSPKKIYYLATQTFEGKFDKATIKKWLKTFIRRFFAQQFKRSCLPDGVKIGSVTLSPRGDWRMPSDAVSRVWQKEVEEIADD